MKKLFSITIVLLFGAINFANAQSTSGQLQFVTLGGNKSGSTLSIAQILDYPVLLAAAKDETVESYELHIVTESTKNATLVLEVAGKRFSQTAIGFLNSLKGTKGSIANKNIILYKENIRIKEKDLEYTFDQ